MNRIVHKTWLGAGVILALLWMTVGSAMAANRIVWNRATQRVDASIETWDTAQVLQRVAAATGWEIYLDPSAVRVYPTRFKSQPVGDALRRMLGDLSFAQVPQSNAPPRLYVFRSSRQDATTRIQAAADTDARRIEDELLVTLKPGESIEDLARRTGATVTGRIDSINAYRLKFKDAASAEKARSTLAGDPSVASVEDNYLIPRPEAPGASTLPPGRLSLNPKAPPDGKYLIVGLIDTAVQPKEGKFESFLAEGVKASDAASDQPTHGTGMAEAVLNGLASVLGKDAPTSVRILPVDVYGGKESTSSFDVAAGIAKAIDGGARLVNLSLGSPIESGIMSEVIQNGYDQGIRFFAAAGNEPVTTPTWPAADPNVIGVTALDNTGNIAEYANRGDFVRAAASGTSRITFNDQPFLISGTSASTAHISGLTAGMMEKNRLSAAEAANQLLKAKSKP